MGLLNFFKPYKQIIIIFILHLDYNYVPSDVVYYITMDCAREKYLQQLFI